MRFWTALLLGNFLLASQVQARLPSASELFRNRKETAPTVFGKRTAADASLLLHSLGLSDPQVIGWMVASIDADVSGTSGACETAILANLKRNLEVALNTTNQEKIAEGLRAILVLSRQQNVIDDLTYLQLSWMWQIPGWWLLEEKGIIEAVTLPTDRISGEELRRLRNRFNDEDLKSVFQELPQQVSRVCLVDQWRALAKDLSERAGVSGTKQLRLALYRAYELELINGAEFSQFEILRKFEAERLAISLSEYRQKLARVMDVKLPNGAVSAPSPFMSKIVKAKKTENRSVRVNLYKRYSPTQIKLMAEVVDNVSKRTLAEDAFIQFTYNSSTMDQERIQLSAMEKYRLSLKLLQREMADLQTSRAFDGVGFGYEEVVAAAFETGLVSAQEMDVVLNYEDFWNPKIPMGEKIYSYTTRFLRIATSVIPPPYNVISTLGMIVIEAVHEQLKEPPVRANVNSLF